MRTSRGRILAKKAYKHLGASVPKNQSQLELIAIEEVTTEDEEI